MHGVKKQIWLTKEENDLLHNMSQKTCLTEADYIRMLLHNRIPKEKPGPEFYKSMNQISMFSEQLQSFAIQFRESGNCNMDELQKEVNRWHQFQLSIEKQYLISDKATRP